MLLVGCSVADASGRARGPSEGGPTSAAEAVAAYNAALDPLRRRSDVLEQRFAEVQAANYDGPDTVRDVLAEIIPQYAGLLEQTRAIEVEHPALVETHEILLASLERQQEGLEMALRALDTGDDVLMAEAGLALKEAQGLVQEHRVLLRRARRG
jgi:hypothetical protein